MHDSWWTLTIIVARIAVHVPTLIAMMLSHPSAGDVCHIPRWSAKGTPSNEPKDLCRNDIEVTHGGGFRSAPSLLRLRLSNLTTTNNKMRPPTTPPTMPPITPPLRPVLLRLDAVLPFADCDINARTDEELMVAVVDVD